MAPNDLLNVSINFSLTFETFQAENGTEVVLGEEDNKLIKTVCTGVCANGTSTQSVINATCEELESGPEWVDKDKEILTIDRVNKTYEKHCVGEWLPS